VQAHILQEVTWTVYCTEETTDVQHDTPWLRAVALATMLLVMMMAMTFLLVA